MSERDDCGGDCGSCARCKDRERQEEQLAYEKQMEEERFRAEEEAFYGNQNEETPRG